MTPPTFLQRMAERVRLFKLRHPRVWAALKTAAAAFVAIAAPAIFLYFHDVLEWANGTQGDFPSPDGVVKALVAGAFAAGAGLVNYAWNAWRGNVIMYANKGE